MTKSVAGRVLLSVLGASLTLAVARGASLLPYGAARDRVSDVLAWPGGLIARVFYPAGVHTGSGSPEWGGLVLWANVAFYVVLWFTILTAAGRRGRRANGHPSGIS